MGKIFISITEVLRFLFFKKFGVKTAFFSSLNFCIFAGC